MTGHVDVDHLALVGLDLLKQHEQGDASKPVTLFDLPMQPDLKSRIALAWRTAAERAPSSMVAWGFRTAVELGLLLGSFGSEHALRGVSPAGDVTSLIAAAVGATPAGDAQPYRVVGEEASDEDPDD